MNEDFILPKPFSPTKKEAEQYQYIKSNKKDFLQHHDKIKSYKNQQYLIKCRKHLKFPHPNRGFKLNRRPNRNIKNQESQKYYEHLTALREYSETYKQSLWSIMSDELHSWIRSFQSEYQIYYNKVRQDIDDWRRNKSIIKMPEATVLGWKQNLKLDLYVEDKINRNVADILNKWQLSPRYDKAIRELLLFNRIIPANGKIWLSKSVKNNDYPEHPEYRQSFIIPENKLGAKLDYKLSINFYINETTKSELKQFIDNIPNSKFKEKKLSYAPTKNPPPNIKRLRNIIREKYTIYKSDNKKLTDDAIAEIIREDFQIEHRDYADLATSFIKKYFYK